MLLDCFIFFRELDLLEGRLEYLYDVVDYFIIVEADITHAGNKKELNFLKNIDRFKPYLDKIIYQPIVIDTDQFNDRKNIDSSKPDSFSWRIENAHRSHLDNVLKLFDDDAVVMLSDLDEFPVKSKFDTFLGLLNTFDAFVLIQRLYFYNFNQYSNDPWPGTIITKNKLAKSMKVQCLRDMRFNIPKVFDAGYHLSYWGTPEDFKIKLESFAHQDINTPINTDIKKITYQMNNGLEPSRPVTMIKSTYKDIDSDFYAIFKKYAKTNKKTYIQIGAGAGDRDPRSNFRDGFTEYVKSLDRNQIDKIILVEANPMNIEKLKETWQDYPEAMILSCGISSGPIPQPTVNFYYADEDAPHYHVFSMDKEHVRKHYPTVDIKEMEVACMSFSEFIDRCIKPNTVEMLALDIKGLEANLILETDWKTLKVNQISFENIHLGDKSYAVTKKLSQDGYLEAGIGLDHNGYDVLYKKVD